MAKKVETVSVTFQISVNQVLLNGFGTLGVDPS
jgi:hypothetical protein